MRSFWALSSLARQTAGAATMNARILGMPSLRRFATDTPIVATATELAHRGILRVSGPDSTKFLQGLLTNDINRLVQNGDALMYSMLLNAQGRVLFDVFVYRDVDFSPSDPRFLVEHDAAAGDEVMQHLKRFKLRSKVAMEPIGTDKRVWCVVNHEQQDLAPSSIGGADPRYTSGAWSGAYQRLHRVVCDKGVSPVAAARTGALEGYHAMRMDLGLGEGTVDFTPGKSLPLECNLDYLNGVSFTKGCYLGQELTARTHHTGVVRKRILPMVLAMPQPDSDMVICAPGTEIEVDSGRSAGKLCSQYGHKALALVRLQHVEDGDSMFIQTTQGKVAVSPFFPLWWPKQEPKTVVETEAPPPQQQ